MTVSTATLGSESTDNNVSNSKTISASQVASKYITATVNEEVVSAAKETEPRTLASRRRMIVVAVDDSAPAQHALSWTLDHLAAPGDQLCLLNVRPYAVAESLFNASLTDFYPGAAANQNAFSEDYVEAVERFNRDASHDLLRAMGDHVLQRGLLCRAIALRGDPREEILAKVAEINPDMLVTGCRGLGFLEKTFRGSLSDYLVQNAKCVVIVPKMK
ncbi:hypothetical protein HK100_000117 [Physocladia obscura]|uniref:UspA domain-containing protein n=1 Tax=Physocladia obscura TaxID=109957 RepID=A0AAD5T1F5_9FUNG|nr:hypothetical protein HK100_000117 [Physocladia obscura]